MNFDQILASRIQKIFDLKRVTYDRPSEHMEQECAFLEIRNVRARVRDGRETAQVQGMLHVLAQAEKMPMGYLAKRIDAAEPADKRDFFFQTEESRGTFRNIVERSLEFVFLYDAQYDPDQGQLTAVTLNTTEI